MGQVKIILFFYNIQPPLFTIALSLPVISSDYFLNNLMHRINLMNYNVKNQL